MHGHYNIRKYLVYLSGFTINVVMGSLFLVQLLGRLAVWFANLMEFLNDFEIPIHLSAWGDPANLRNRK
jgi:hypothetical protein